MERFQIMSAEKMHAGGIALLKNMLIRASRVWIFPTTKYLDTPKLLSHLNDTKLNKALKRCMLEILTMQCKVAIHCLLAYSMTSLLTHTVAHSTRPSYRPKINNQPLKKFLSLMVSWVKVVKNGKILTFEVNFLCQKLSESF